MQIFFTGAEARKREVPFLYKKLSFRRRSDTDLLAHLSAAREQEVPAVTFERLAQPKIRWRPQREVMQWLNSIEDWRDKQIAKLMYQTGMRREEVVNLKIWNLPERSGLDLSRPEASFTIIGKGSKKRLIYLATRSLLEIYDYIRTERALLVRGAREKTDHIFVVKKASSKSTKLFMPLSLLRSGEGVNKINHIRSFGERQ